MAIDLTGIVTWLKGWFYDKTEITGFLNNKANQSDLQTLSGTVTTLSGTVDGKADKSGGVAQVTDGNAGSYTSIGGLSNGATQQTINNAINTKIGELGSIKAIEVVSSLPTASSSTMGKLYILSEDGKINVYYTKQTGSTYAWEKLDDDILDELSIDWSDVQNKPSTFTPSSHTHGYINNNGYIANQYIVSGVPEGILGYTSNFKICAYTNIGASIVKDNNTYAHIGVSEATQQTINNAINTKIGTIKNSLNNKQNIGECITSIELVAKADDETGAIRLYYGDES